jgi:hypothetical protein
MTDKEFNSIVAETFTTCERILVDKKIDYANGDRDRLHNFKVIATRLQVTPEKACSLLMCKHETALDDFIEDIGKRSGKSIDQWQEKVLDIINYHVLLLALVIERRGDEPLCDIPVEVEPTRKLHRDDCAKVDTGSIYYPHKGTL